MAWQQLKERYLMLQSRNEQRKNREMRDVFALINFSNSPPTRASDGGKKETFTNNYEEIDLCSENV